MRSKSHPQVHSLLPRNSRDGSFGVGASFLVNVVFPPRNSRWINSRISLPSTFITRGSHEVRQLPLPSSERAEWNVPGTCGRGRLSRRRSYSSPLVVNQGSAGRASYQRTSRARQTKSYYVSLTGVGVSLPFIAQQAMGRLDWPGRQQE